MTILRKPLPCGKNMIAAHAVLEKLDRLSLQDQQDVEGLLNALTVDPATIHVEGAYVHGNYAGHSPGTVPKNNEFLQVVVNDHVKMIVLYDGQEFQLIRLFRSPEENDGNSIVP